MRPDTHAADFRHSMVRARLRTLLISSYFPPQVGGISRMMAEICRHLGPSRVAAVSGYDGTGLEHCLAGIRTYHSASAFDKSRRDVLLRLAALIGRAALHERPNLLQFGTADDAWIAWWAQRLTRLPQVIYAHGNEILSIQRSDWAKPREALLGAAAIIANSRYTAGLVRGLGVNEERVKVIHPGCDTERFRPVPVPEGFREKLTGRADAYPVMLSVGNLVARKGHDLAIRALPALLDHFPRLSYVIVGDGIYRHSLESLAHDLGVSAAVRFVGRGIDDELPAYYAASDFFAMPSRAQLEKDDVEGFGIVFLEAAACGKATIGGRSGGISDAIEEDVTGFLVDPHDPADFARAVIRLVDTPELLTRFGKAGQARVNRDFTWAASGAAITEALEDVIAGWRTRRASDDDRDRR